MKKLKYQKKQNTLSNFYKEVMKVAKRFNQDHVHVEVEKNSIEGVSYRGYIHTFSFTDRYSSSEEVVKDLLRQKGISEDHDNDIVIE